ncbi:hypothetical protein [Riemerella anatipestifer]|uniref:Cell wall anchor protein n=1 Tax=Riemerella anatipestifer TaxID=34085 RepID=A0AAP6HEZ5_RIEAN|nr:hypothetical protein [Riemerella anatipestifer]MCO7355060.1 hypothetical protein [Riemerella anatipestifer]MCU7540750.1 hypothetical protein [Riemerella anatipestifer]MCU7570652.1 hypothetical protein [Riemerella anatipestifer]MCU7597855.1 hypothetical protein [Riemerella anatipestifer]MCW0494645.1 hypothetical protein [Riemerella anatipestifer]
MRKLSFLFASVISILSYSQATRELIVSDTRDIDDLPNAFSRNFKIDFKKRNTINVPGSGAYSTTISVNPWVNRDNSGGKVHQLNFNDGGIYHRSALPLSNKWGEWREFILKEPNGSTKLGITDIQNSIRINYTEPDWGISIRSANGPWSRLYGFSLSDFSNTLGGFGACGPANELEYLFVGNSYYNPIAKFYTADKRVLFEGNIATNGKIEAKEVKVTTTPTAGFVFAEDYRLPKLEEVEKHIRDKKHLPEIASATQMEKEGVNIGEFQIKLLQKIEELTLYIIELNKQNKELKKRIEKLEKQK